MLNKNENEFRWHDVNDLTNSGIHFNQYTTMQKNTIVIAVSAVHRQYFKYKLAHTKNGKVAEYANLSVYTYIYKLNERLICILIILCQTKMLCTRRPRRQFAQLSLLTKNKCKLLRNFFRPVKFINHFQTEKKNI